jgi:MurNAc alpha-1-phosphate uridylyltransferase
MKAMILAAGRGERMRPLTNSVPKPLLVAGARPLIDYHIEALVKAGIEELVINLAWCGEQIRDHIGDGSRFGATVRYSDEGATALETGGGVQRALPLLGPEPFWLVNGDIYCEFDFANHRPDTGVMGHLVLVPNPDHNPNGDFYLENNCVRNSGRAALTYSGIAVLHPGLFSESSPGKFPLAPLLVSAADRGEISGEVFEGRWFDVGTTARLKALDRLLS